MKKFDVLASLLLLIGGINWGLVGLFDFNLIEYVFARMWLDRLIFIVIGLAALYRIVSWKSVKERWK